MGEVDRRIVGRQIIRAAGRDNAIPLPGQGLQRGVHGQTGRMLRRDQAERGRESGFADIRQSDD